MAHEITRTDGAVYAGKRAWHGLGVVVEHAPTPTEALRIAGMEWQVEQWALTASDGDERREGILSHVANVRSDTGDVLGVVGAGYKPVQNHELAEFCEALAQEGDVTRVESMGSIRGGRRVWALLRGASFSVRENDEVVPYILVANGHDGSLALTCQNTSIRVVCSNTLHWALGQGSGAFRFRHCGDVKTKLEEARRALRLYERTRSDMIEGVELMAKRELNRAELQELWTGVYMQTEGDWRDEKDDKKRSLKLERTQVALGKIAANFDRDRQRTRAPADAWTALNAMTEWQQHQRASWGRDDHARSENRVYSDVWGAVAEKKAVALKATLSIAGASVR